MGTSFDQLPVTQASRPYLPRIDYASDDLASVRARLIARLPEALPGWNPMLAQGGTDHGALLAELFAHMAAILHAYADQRANESFVRTATLTRSLIDLAQLIDYRLGHGASASALQAFYAQPDKSGLLPAGFRLNAVPGGNAPPLVFETTRSLDVQPSRNHMRLFGFDRSARLLRLRAAASATQDANALLDARYSGLKAGVPVVFDDGATLVAVPPAAIGEVDGATQLAWAAGTAAQDHDLLIAGLTVRGRPQQTARLAAAERADEITLGQNLLPVADARLFSAGDAVLIDYAGLQMAATVLARAVSATQSPAGTLTLDRGVTTSLRRSATRVLAGTACGGWTNVVGAGATYLVREPLGAKLENSAHIPAAGDTLLIADAGGVQMVSVAKADKISFTLAQPLLRALRPASHAPIRFYAVAANDPATPQTTLRPVLLGDLDGVYAGGDTVLALDRSLDAFGAGSVVALGDGATFSAHTVVRAESVDERTRLTLQGHAPDRLRVALLGVHGAFEHVMHVQGHDHAEGSLAAGAAQLDIDGAPLGLAAGLDLVIADGVHAEGARITQVLPLAGRVRISLARPLDHAYALGDAILYGNVVEASHGEGAADEVLGGGDPSAAPQRFELHRSPLAWLADASAPRGVAPAVEVFVGGERWTRVETLAESDAQDRDYVIDIDDRERASVVFGDGTNGAAPPSGRSNIVARYRDGRGSGANVKALAIDTMPQATSFLERSFNPLAASGGADSEQPAPARRNAALRVHTLDRAVSVADYADLALGYAGVGKASAAIEREGRGAGAQRLIVVTCMAAGGNELSTPQREALLDYLRSRSPEPERVRIRGCRVWPIRLALTVYVLPGFRQAAVQAALLAAFGNAGAGYFAFEQRALGSELALSDVYALAEATAGVDHVLATLFHAEAEAPRVADRIRLPADALATGGDATDAAVGRLSLQLIGGLS